MREKVGLAQVWKKCVRKHVELWLEGKLGGQRESRGRGKPGLDVGLVSS